MSAFLTKYNSDDVFFRAVTVGLLNFMSSKLQIWNVINDQTYEYPVPFYYNASGDERFMQDIFQQHTLNDCITEKVVEGNTDVIPRGHITLSNITVQASELSNRFVRGEWTKAVADELLTYNSPMNIIPLILNYDVEIHVDGQLMAFKLAQRIIQTFYKAYPFEFMWEGYALRGAVAFPEDIGKEDVYEFSFGDDTTTKITFSLEVEAKLPVVDMTQTFLKSNSIQEFNVEVNPGNIYWHNRSLDGERLPDEIIPTDGAINFSNFDASLLTDEITSSESRVDYLNQLFNIEEKTKPGSHTNLGDPTNPGIIQNDSQLNKE